MCCIDIDIDISSRYSSNNNFISYITYFTESLHSLINDLIICKDHVLNFDKTVLIQRTSIDQIKFDSNILIDVDNHPEFNRMFPTTM